MTIFIHAGRRVGVSSQRAARKSSRRTLVGAPATYESVLRTLTYANQGFGDSFVFKLESAFASTSGYRL
jgi:hypothetical protein